MSKINYYKFLDILPDFEHIFMPEDEQTLEVRAMPAGFAESILELAEIGKIHPVVISRAFVEQHSLKGTGLLEKYSHYFYMKEVPFQLPMPFPTIWLEFMDVGVVTPMLGGVLRNRPIQVVGYLVKEVQDICGEPAYWFTALAYETEEGPDGAKNIADVFTVTDILTKSAYENFQNGIPAKVTGTTYVWHHQIFDVLTRMCTQKKVGIDRTKAQVRVGKGDTRRLIKIKNIVYVVPTSERSSVERTLGRNIDWTHRWEVRGHWRKIKHIGKDEAGNYCEAGRTWIVPSVKGPEDKPLIPKVRYALPNPNPFAGTAPAVKFGNNSGATVIPFKPRPE